MSKNKMKISSSTPPNTSECRDSAGVSLTTTLKMNCCTEASNNNKRTSSTSTDSNHRHHRRRCKLSPTLVLLVVVILARWLSQVGEASDPQWGHRRRHQRRLVVQVDPLNGPTSSPANNNNNIDADTLKVAALASRLEQWFLCRRLAPLTTSGALNGARCPAHFDGHLCWPPEPPSVSALRLPCPRLMLGPEIGLPTAQHHQLGAELGNQSSGQVATGASQREQDLAYAQRSCVAPTRLVRRLKTEDEEENNLMLATMAQHTKPTNPKTHAEQPQWEPQADYSKCPSTGDEGNFDPTDKWIKLEDEGDRRLFQELVDQLDRIEATIDPYSEPDLQEQWTLCIGNIMRHLRTITSPSSNSTMTTRMPGGDLWCPIIFDGWRCWPTTRANEIAYVSCPSNQPGFSAERKAHKICTDLGQWYKHPMTNRYWSNYTTCVDTVDLAFRTKILNLYVIGNLISLVALTASLIIFISFKSLKCTRVTIHKNLFLSFITNNLMWIIWYTCVVNDADLLQSNPLQCQVWHILLHYFLVSNYFWMFCEGLYLHTLLVVAFVSEDKILKWFYLLGWLTPLPITLAYAYNRAYDEYYTNFCWMEESPYNLILMAPIGISLLLNLVFLINIVRVLVTKLRANNSPDAHQTRKAVRATLILIPLLGLHYILTPFRPEAKSEWEVIYESVAAVCTSFQGLCVALLFCFCNGEVITAIKKKLKDTFNLQQRSSHQTTATSSGEIAQMRARSNTGASLIGSNSLGGGFGAPPLSSLVAGGYHLAPPKSADTFGTSVSTSCLDRTNGLSVQRGNNKEEGSSLLALANTNQGYLAEDHDATTKMTTSMLTPELVSLLDKSTNQVRDCPV